jgi:Zn-dependent peptidase ImmA (M78 family)
MTLAHELGHLLMHGGAHAKARMAGGNTHAPTAKPYERAEWQANKFASSFLMPTHVVRDFVSAMDLADSCLVSLQAAAIRIEQVGRILKKPLPTCVQDAIKVLEGVSEQPKPR